MASHTELKLVSQTNFTALLGNVNNTSDANKPISGDVSTALSNKVDKVSGKGLSEADITAAEKLLITHSNKVALDAVAGTNTGDQDLSGKVDKITGSSLLADGEITRLAAITGTNTGDQDLTGKVDKVTGSSLITDASITRLANTQGTNTGDQDLSSFATTTAVTAAIDLAVVGLYDDRGNYTASVGGSYPTTGGSAKVGSYMGSIIGDVLVGDIWIVASTGTLPGPDSTTLNVEPGDMIRALFNAPANSGANWAIIQANIGYVTENSANKENVSFAASSVKYPTIDLLNTGLGTKQATLTIGISGNIKTINGDSILGSGDLVVNSVKYHRKTAIFAGAQNGTNTAFTVTHDLSTDSEQAFQNGMLLRVGATHDYTLVGRVFTFNTAPAASDALVFYGVH